MCIAFISTKLPILLGHGFWRFSLSKLSSYGFWSMAHEATVGIFLPAFVFVAASGPLVPRIRRSPTAGAFLDGVNAAALALMVVVTHQLGRAAIIDLTTIALAVISGAILFRFRLNSAWLVLGGGIAGWLLYGRV
jgi:chromate transporter